MNQFRNFLLKNRITPKWVIFVLDLSICTGAIILANLILLNSGIHSQPDQSRWADILITLLCSGFFISVFKTYDGIIRYSDFHEALRSLTAVMSSFTGMLMLNMLFSFLGYEALIPTASLVIYFFIASFFMVGYRVVVKILYNQSIKEEARVNVIIYGAGLNASPLMKTIEQISGNRYHVAALIDNDEKIIGKTIDHIRVYPVSQLTEVIKIFNIHIFFLATNNFDISIKNKMVDECLAYHVKVMNIPPVKSWIHGHLNLGQLQEVKIEELLGRPPIQLCNSEVVNFLFGKRILITGAAGSIGSELARQISAMSPGSLIICDQVETGLHNLEYDLQKKYSLGNRLKFYLGDVKDEYAMDQMFSTYLPNIVFHAAAYKHVPMMENHPSEAIRNNVLGTKVIADLSEIYGVDRFLFISTDKAINPTNIMGASKRIAEMYCHSLHHFDHNTKPADTLPFYQLATSQRRTRFITTRFGNVLASNGSVIPRFHEQIKNGGPVTVTHPDVMRYFMTIHEACSLVLEAVTMGHGGEVYMFDMGEPVKILDLAKKMILLAGYEPGTDIEITFSGLRPGEKLYEELLNKEEKVMPTHHKKILIAKVTEENYSKISEEINSLLQMANECKDDTVVKQMKYIVPEYISNNSVYELYDMPSSNNKLPLKVSGE